jgi:hypothetical protein
VNQKLPLAFVWNPRGYATGYQFQVSLDSSFNNLMLNDSLLTSPTDTLKSVVGGTTYYWRVRARNYGQISSWSSVRRYSATLPYITVTSPAGHEEWQRGMCISSSGRAISKTSEDRSIKARTGGIVRLRHKRGHSMDNPSSLAWIPCINQVGVAGSILVRVRVLGCFGSTGIESSRTSGLRWTSVNVNPKRRYGIDLLASASLGSRCSVLGGNWKRSWRIRAADHIPFPGARHRDQAALHPGRQSTSMVPHPLAHVETKMVLLSSQA